MFSDINDNDVVLYIVQYKVKKMEKNKMENKKLRRIPEKGWIGGVCAGFAYYFELPVWIVRLVWTITFLGMGFGIWVYILFWIFMPRIKEVPADYDEVTGD